MSAYGVAVGVAVLVDVAVGGAGVFVTVDVAVGGREEVAL